MNIKAIETEYNGYMFRSRLEARWAVFFDTLNIEYKYETEGWEMDGGRYLPDFWLPDLKQWAEIKAETPTDLEREKMGALVIGSGYEGMIICGDPWPTQHKVLRFMSLLPSAGIWPTHHIAEYVDLALDSGDWWVAQVLMRCTEQLYWEPEKTRLHEIMPPSQYPTLALGAAKPWREESLVWAGCTICGAISITPPNSPGCCMSCWRKKEERRLNTEAPRLIDALATARQARFEFGETPQGPQNRQSVTVSIETPTLKVQPQSVAAPIQKQSWQVGNKVYHQTFGAGIVAQIEPLKDEMVVAFFGKGVKRFVISAAKFERWDATKHTDPTVKPRDISYPEVPAAVSVWDQLVDNLGQLPSGRVLAAMLREMAMAWPARVENGVLVLGVKWATHTDSLNRPQCRQLIEDGLKNILGHDFSIRAETLPESTRPALVSR